MIINTGTINEQRKIHSQIVESKELGPGCSVGILIFYLLGESCLISETRYSWNGKSESEVEIFELKLSTFREKCFDIAVKIPLLNREK